MVHLPENAHASSAPRRGAASLRRPRALADLAWRTLVEGTRGQAPKEAALLAYTILFALGPLLVLAIETAGLFQAKQAARQALVTEFSRLTGGKGGQVLEDLLAGAAGTTFGPLGTTLGLLALLAFAGLAFAQLKWSLNRIWAVTPRKHDGWKARLLGACRRNLGSAAGALGVGFLLLVSFLGSILLAGVGAWLAAAIPGEADVARVLTIALGALVAWILFAALFKLLPDAEVAWRDVGIGAAVTTLLFFAGQLVLSTYFARGSLATAYGAAGGILMLLVWVYYSCVIVLYGAQFTQVYANLYGSCVHPDENAEAAGDSEEESSKQPARKGTGG